MSGFSVNGADLSTIFKAIITTPGPTTNFKDSTGNDLNQLFQVSNTPGTFGQDQISYDTSYVTIYNSVSCDLRYIFQNINAGPIYYSPAANFVLVQSGSSYTLSCIQSNDNTIIFNVAINNIVVTLVGGGGAGGASSNDKTNGGGGGGGGNIGQYTLSVTQGNVFSSLNVGEGGTAPNGAGGTTSGTFQNSSGSNNYSISGGTGGVSATNSNGGSGGASGWSGGSGGNGGASPTAATNGSSGPQYTISGTSYYFGGCGGGGSYDNQASSSSGGLGGGGGAGFGSLGNNGQSYTTPYGTTYAAGSNSFPNTGGGGAGGNGNGSQVTSGQSGNSGIIVISFTYS